MNRRTKGKIKLMIADDQVLLMGGMKLLLEKFEDFEIVACINNVENILKTYQSKTPNVVICDVKFDVTNRNNKTGMDALQEILKFDADAKVIMYSQFDDEENIRQVYNNGAKAFMTKDIDVDEMANAIRQVNLGESYFTDKVARKLAALSIRKKNSNDNNPQAKLSERQLTIFILGAKGFTQTEIAEKLNLHQRTITSEMAKLKELLGIERQAEMTLLAVAHNLIDTKRAEFSELK